MVRYGFSNFYGQIFMFVYFATQIFTFVGNKTDSYYSDL